MIEEVVSDLPAPSASHAGRGLGAHSAPRRLAEITGDVDERMSLSMGEFARVLGGGVVPGSVVLIGGDPGIGKSTLLLQVALEMARSTSVLYVSGEESERQIKMRAMRLLRLEVKDGAKGKQELLGSAMDRRSSRMTCSWSPKPTWQSSWSISAR